MKVGDPYRLEHIKLMLKQKRTVYGSDRAYLDHLIHDYIEEVKIQKKLSKLRGEDPFEETPETITFEEDVEDEDRDELIELEHIYCWKCGKSIPINSKFCLDCGSEIKKPEVRQNIVKETPDKISDEKIKKISPNTNKKNILIVAGVLAILAIIGAAVVMEGTFDKTISSIEDTKPLPKENSIATTPDSTSKCGSGTVFDDATNTCLLDDTQPTSKCGSGTVFDDATNTCLLDDTQPTSKCGSGTVFDDATNTCLLDDTQPTSKCGSGTVFDDATNTCLLDDTQPTSKCGSGTVFDDATNTCLLDDTQPTSKCGSGTVFDDATNTCLLDDTQT